MGSEMCIRDSCTAGRDPPLAQCGSKQQSLSRHPTMDTCKSHQMSTTPQFGTASGLQHRSRSPQGFSYAYDYQGRRGSTSPVCSYLCIVFASYRCHMGFYLYSQNPMSRVRCGTPRLRAENLGISLPKHTRMFSSCRSYSRLLYSVNGSFPVLLRYRMRHM